MIIAQIFFLHHLHRFWLRLAGALFSVVLIVAFFFQVYLPMVRGVTLPSDRWEIEYPYAYPVATVCFVLSLVSFTLGFWDVWGLLTLPVIFFLGMGAFMAALIIL